MALEIVKIRPYSLAFEVRRKDGTHLHLEALIDYLLAAPPDCMLARIMVEADHSPRYPRLKMIREGSRSVQLQVYIKEGESAEQVFGYVRDLFAKTDWSVE